MGTDKPFQQTSNALLSLLSTFFTRLQSKLVCSVSSTEL